MIRPPMAKAPTTDPTIEEGSRERKLEAYRNVRDELVRKIRQRFGPKG